jgi:transposase InsO family protein
MADSMMENPKPGDLLEGQTNIVSWLRKFERAARAADVFEILTKQEEVISKKPVKTDYIKIKPTTRAQSKKTIAAADEAAASASETETSKDAFAEYKIDMEEYKENRKKVLKARGLLGRWVTDIIATEMEEELSDPQDPVAAFAYIKDTYKVSEAFVRKEILTKVTTLKLDNFESMAAYWNQHRQFKVDLIKAGYKAYGDDEMATNILAGLPAGYRNFVNHYEFDQLKQGEDSHDTKFLFKALLAEEVKVKAWKEEKKDREREKNTNKKSTYKGQENAKPDRQGSESATTNTASKDNLKCDHCGKSRHTAERCWTLHPELVPKALKERFDSGKADTKINKPNGFSGLATTDVDRFNNALAEAGKGGTKPPGPHEEPTADHCAQTSRTGSGDGDSWASGIEPGCCGEGEDGTARCEGQDAITALAVGSFSSMDTWLIDSGCNMHITNNKKWYTTFHALDLQIATADGQTSLQILGGGSVQLNLFTSRNKRTPITLHNVAYAPNARCNLISLSQLLEEGQISSQKADGTGMTLLTGQETVGEAKKEDGLYYARVEKEVRVDEPFAAAVDYKDPVMIWHRRLGHLGFQNMRNLLKASTGMDITDEQIRAKIKTVCPICAITRGTVKVPRDPAKRHAQEPGRLMHVDTWGPYPIEAWDGTTRFLFITDDATRMTWSARVPRKRMLSAIFKRLHKKIQRTHGFSTRMYRLDGEFSRGPIGRWIESKGMTLEDTAPYEHYQNGVAERANRIIREKAAPMIQEATITKRITKIITEESIALMRSCELPENLWPEAIEHAVWLKNRSPARALRKREKKTPWEAMFDDKPTLSRERIWGSRAYVTLPHEKTTFTPKLHSPRAWPGYFVGCASESTYRIYSAEKGKVFKVGVARIEDGQGLDEPQDEPSLNARIPPADVDLEYLEDNEEIAPSGSQGDSSDEDDEENSQHGGSEHPGEDQEDQLFLNSPEDRHSHSDTSMRNERMESERSPERLPSDIRGNRNPSSQERDAIAREHARREHVRRSRERSDGSDGEDEEDLDTSETSSVEYNEVSKFFAGMGKVGKRPLRNLKAGTPNDALDTSDKESDISEMSSTDEEEKITKKKAKRGVPIRRFADDTKCNRCFRGRLRCDRSEVGVPCTQCKEGKRPCYDQTPETRKLITPDSERPGNNLKKQKMEDKCDVCLKDGSRCVRTPGEPKCVRCKSKRRTCIDAKPETISAILDEKAQKKAKKEEKKEKKCHRCVRYGLACNGQRPCDNCPSSRTAPFCMSTREWDEYNKTA